MKKIENYLENYNKQFLKVSNINKDVIKKLNKLYKLTINIININC